MLCQLPPPKKSGNKINTKRACLVYFVGLGVSVLMLCTLGDVLPLCGEALIITPITICASPVLANVNPNSTVIILYLHRLCVCHSRGVSEQGCMKG